MADDRYWVFVCNPDKWEIDKFFETAVDQDTWGVRPSDSKHFAPGQLGVVRVGVDRRARRDLGARSRLTPGIYALCQVESEAFPGTGANDKFWRGRGREPGWPTVNVRYLRTYLNNPVTIETLKAAQPSLSPLLLRGFQAASFPISRDEFRYILESLGEEADELPATQLPTITEGTLAAMEERYLRATPEVREQVSRRIERGPIGALVKRLNGFCCQICAAQGSNPLGFRKENGEPYVEAHHVMPVSQREIGTLAASNIMTVCPNHHRELHYGRADVIITDTVFDLSLSGKKFKIPRLQLRN